ncbi:MAG TPA: MFS transporter [Actinomycetota bacterium]
MNWVRVRSGPPIAALRGVAANRSLRRVEASFLLFNLAEGAVWVAILVYAFQRGGTQATGLVGLMLLVPAGIIAPVAAALGDRYRRERVLAIGHLVQVAAVGATAVAMLADLENEVVYGFAIVAAAAMTTTRPAHHSLLPGLARTPDEVTAANSVSSLAEGIGGTLGTLATAALLALGEPGAVYAVMAGVLAFAALSLVGVHAERSWPDGEAMGPLTLVTDAVRGFVSIARSRDPRLLVALAALMTVAYGAFDVLLVSIAIEELGIGESGVGLLQTSVGVGALVGAAGSVTLVGRRAMVPAFLFATAMLALGIAGSAVATTVAVVLVAVLVTGGALTLLDVVGRTLLQRVADDDLLTRVFGVVEALWMAGVGVGAAIAAVLVNRVGLQAALVSVAVGIVVFTLPTIGGLRRLDRDAVMPVRQLELLRNLTMFAPLPGPELERVARQMDLVATTKGTDVVRQGEYGDRFYVIDEGTFQVVVDGRPVRALHEGDHFGEIALLHDVPRTATVTATEDGAVWTLDQEEFLATVTGMPQASNAAHAISTERLRGRPRSG